MEKQYTELYKKYRPTKWDDVIGQDSAVKQLKSAIANNQLPTAYCFTGGPGQGKTTLALLLAKAVNCTKFDENGNPDPSCPVCQAIDNNNQLGVRYISMANNGSADDVRKLVADARLSQPIKKQVFILDEAHNMSPQAFDAFLIPLEAKDLNAMFIFCTTEPNKMRPAVMSRCQVLNLPPVNYKLIAKKLYQISQLEGIQVSKEDLILCAQNADGSVRNGIRNLETLWQDGKLPTSVTSQVVESLLKGDTVELLQLSTKIQNDGGDFPKSLEKIYQTFANSLKEKAQIDTNDKTAKQVADILSMQMILKCITIISDGIEKITNKVIDSKVLFEIPLIKVSLLINKFLTTKGA